MYGGRHLQILGAEAGSEPSEIVQPQPYLGTPDALPAVRQRQPGLHQPGMQPGRQRRSTGALPGRIDQPGGAFPVPGVQLGLGL